MSLIPQPIHLINRAKSDEQIDKLKTLLYKQNKTNIRTTKHNLIVHQQNLSSDY